MKLSSFGLEGFEENNSKEDEKKSWQGEGKCIEWRTFTGDEKRSEKRSEDIIR